MDSFGIDKGIFEMTDSEVLKGICWELMDPDSKGPILSDDIDQDMDDLTDDSDWAAMLENNTHVILNDRMITDAVPSPRIQSEHSYSLVTAEEAGDSGSFAHKYDFGKDIENEAFQTMMPSDAYIKQEQVFIKQEPMSNSPSPSPPPSSLFVSSQRMQQQSLLKHSQRHPRLNQTKVKMEPGFSLPPTPPSSHGSDSEGSQSPVYNQPSSISSSSPTLSQALAAPAVQSSRKSSSSRSVLALNSHGSSSSMRSSSSSSSLISSQPKGATGELMLTEEEKRTLIAEGYPIPTRLPLSKAEEKSLKKIRRKIKNKISAQESRRKKKEYMDSLERKVENLQHENVEYRRRMDSLENNNKSLLQQLHQLQALVGEVPTSILKTVSTQTTTCLMPKKSCSRLGKS